MKFATDYYRVSGTGLNDGCVFLSQRFDAKQGYKPREAETMLVTVQPQQGNPDGFDVTIPLVTDGWITDAWMSDSKTVYLARSDATVSRAPNAMARNLTADAFETTQLPASLFGIWGLGDSCVFAWGDKTEAGRSSHPVFMFDGQVWKELPSPGFEVLSMHGLSPDFVYAAGHDSGIALWDGKQWTRMKAPGPETYTSVFAASRDEAYAVGVNNFVVEGSKHGWAKIAQWNGQPVPLAAVAKWKGELWIGAGAHGLLRRVGKTSELEVVKPNVHARSFDVRKDLVIMTPEMLVATSDGKVFETAARDTVLDICGQRELNDFVK